MPFDQLHRRDFITLLGGAAAAWPLAARAQQSSLPVIAFLTGDSFINMIDAFHQGLNQSGFIEGRNVTIEYHLAEDHHDRLPAMAADLVRRRVAVIVTLGSRPAILAAKAATTTIPIVFQFAGDPVALGFVISLNRRGGNLTGVTTLNFEVGPKRFELLHELLYSDRHGPPRRPEVFRCCRDPIKRRTGSRPHAGPAASSPEGQLRRRY